MIVMKFGGTSVGDPERIRAVADLVRAHLARRPVVVASAHAGVTNLLSDLARTALEKGKAPLDALEARHFGILDALGLGRDLVEGDLKELRSILRGVALVKELTPRTQDAIVSYGERMSCRAVAAHLASVGIAAEAVMAWDAGLVTDSRFGAARPLPGIEAEMKRRLVAIGAGTGTGTGGGGAAQAGWVVPVVTGYIGKNETGQVTTLGRGGSDYTGAIVGAAVDAEEVQIWTDVDGVLTTDPRICRDARVLEEVSFEEASELAFYGAKVIHPATMQPAVEKSIPIVVLNTFNPKAKGTRIVREAAPSREVVKCIALRRGIAVVNLVSSRMLGAHGFIRRMGEVLDRHEVSVDMIATSEVSVSMTVEESQAARLEAALRELEAIGRTTVAKGKAILGVVGQGLRETKGIGAKAFAALARAGINVEMISQGATRINLGVVIDAKDAEAGVRALHEEFFAA